tara:strand:- start:794 stop:1216 length:423 start_codon:yes stop_codon:yes gene_type:complete
MALPVTQQLTDQLNRESVGEIPTTPMEGNVSRPLIISDLLNAMKDLDFNSLVNEYGAMAANTNTTASPGLMSEVKTPPSPLETQNSQEKEAVKVPQGDPEFVAPAPEDIPTPMTDAMNIQSDPNVQNTTANSGLMKPAIA